MSGRASRRGGSSSSVAASPITVPGGKIGSAPSSFSSSKSAGGITPPATIAMSCRSSSSGALRGSRDQGEVAGGRVLTPTVDVRLDRLAGNLFRVWKERADVNVEAEVGEGGGDHLLAPVVTVLPHLGDQDAAVALRLLETLDQSLGVRAGTRYPSTSVKPADHLDVGGMAEP